MIGKIDCPAFGGAPWLRVGWHRRKFVEKILIIIGRGGLSVWLWLRDAVENHDAVAQMDVVTRHPDEALDESGVYRLAIGIHRIEAGLEDRLDEDDNVAAPGLTVMNKGHPLCGRSQIDAVNNQV